MDEAKGEKTLQPATDLPALKLLNLFGKEDEREMAAATAIVAVPANPTRFNPMRNAKLKVKYIAVKSTPKKRAVKKVPAEQNVEDQNDPAVKPKKPAVKKVASKATAVKKPAVKKIPAPTRQDPAAQNIDEVRPKKPAVKKVKAQATAVKKVSAPKRKPLEDHKDPAVATKTPAVEMIPAPTRDVPAAQNLEDQNDPAVRPKKTAARKVPARKLIFPDAQDVEDQNGAAVGPKKPAVKKVPARKRIVPDAQDVEDQNGAAVGPKIPAVKKIPAPKRIVPDAQDVEDQNGAAVGPKKPAVQKVPARKRGIPAAQHLQDQNVLDFQPATNDYSLNKGPEDGDAVFQIEEEKIPTPKKKFPISERIEIVDKVSSVFPELGVGAILDLMNLVTDKHVDTVQTAVEKIINHKLQNQQIVEEFKIQKATIEEILEPNELAIPFIDLTDSIPNEINHEEDKEVDNNLDLMDLARQLAGNDKRATRHVAENVKVDDHKNFMDLTGNTEQKRKKLGETMNTPNWDNHMKNIDQKVDELRKIMQRLQDDAPLKASSSVAKKTSYYVPRTVTATTTATATKESATAATSRSALTEDVEVMIECSCCYNEVPIEYMVQCYEGHLLCCQCLERYAQESVYGQGKGELTCLSVNCEANYPESQLYRALPEKLYAKYEERIRDENLNIADIENFMRCKFCNYGAVLGPEFEYFSCPQCFNMFCRKCEVPFKDHKGLTCEQIEKDVETKLRIDFEEKMSNAKIRTCPSCKSNFTKDSGCNKMTCRCGATMCYICRMPNIDYKHYCQHVRSPTKKGCAECAACFLWSNADQDDKMAICEIKKDALKAREIEGFAMEREIGVPMDTLNESISTMEPPTIIAQPVPPPRPQPEPRPRKRGRAPNVARALVIP